MMLQLLCLSMRQLSVPAAADKVYTDDHKASAQHVGSRLPTGRPMASYASASACACAASACTCAPLCFEFFSLAASSSEVTRA